MARDDTFGLDLFDETASAVGNFPQALRGYDKASVDAYVRDVEAQLSRAKTQLREQQKQLADAAAATSEETDFSKLGAHARGMLRSAEAQANELLTSAQSKAKAIIAEAESTSATTRQDAQSAAETNRVTAAADLAALRKQLADQNAADLQGVKDQARFVREAAERDAAQIIAQAKAEAQLIADRNASECEARIAESQRTVAEQQAELLRNKEAQLVALKQAQDQAASTLNTLLEESKRRADEYRTKIEADSETWDQRLAAVQAEADGIRQSAVTQAEAILANARTEAEGIHAEGLRAAEERKSKLEANLELLTKRHKAILAQLNELSSLAGRSVAEYQDDDSDAPADSPAEGTGTVAESAAADRNSAAEAATETQPMAVTGASAEGHKR